MLTYHYALINNPCERTAKALFDYLRAHPGCLDTLDPEDWCAIKRAVGTAAFNYEREYAAGAEEFVLGLDQRR